jgi:hypothetical protein
MIHSSYMTYLLSQTSGDVYDYIQPKPLHHNWSSILIKFRILKFNYKGSEKVTRENEWESIKISRENSVYVVNQT